MKGFLAVSIVGSSPCCGASQSLKGKRLLLTRDVALPLAACTMPTRCKCRYSKHPDRRADDDRRMFGSTQRASLYGIKRAQIGGRKAPR